MAERDEELTTIQRAAIVGWELGAGRVLTSNDLMRRFGINRNSALELLSLVSVVLPVICMELPSPGGLLEWKRTD